MYSSLQAILSEDKKLTVTSAPPVSEGENNSVSVTVSLPSDTDFTDTEIYLEFLCASGERFITPNLNPSLSASPVVSYLLKSGTLSSSGRCYIQITLVKGDVISKSVLDENSSFLVLPSVNASVSDYEITTLFSAYASALESMSAGVDALMQSLGETKTQLETYSEQIYDIITAAENGEFNGAKGDKGDKGDDGEDFSVDKWFSSVAEMNNDTSLSVGDIAGILYTSSGDGGKIYVKTAVGFSYISQLSGVKGDTGPAPSITVSVSSLPAGSQPSVTKSGTDENPHFAFALPKGDQGSTGPQGPSGPKGDTGATPDISVTAETLSSGSQATVSISGSSASPLIKFGIPAGPQGAKGDQGDTGPQGVKGNQGDPGVTPSITVITTTLNANQSAYCTKTGTDEAPVLTFGIPRGVAGENAVYPPQFDLTLLHNLWDNKEYTVNNIIASPIEGVILELPVPSTESNLIAFNNAQLYIKEIHDTFIIIGCVNTPSDNIAVSFRNVSSSV